jgi:hypothetical protein
MIIVAAGVGRRFSAFSSHRPELSTQARAELLLLGAIVVWSLNFSIAKFALGEFLPLAYLQQRLNARMERLWSRADANGRKSPQREQRPTPRNYLRTAASSCLRRSRVRVPSLPSLCLPCKCHLLLSGSAYVRRSRAADGQQACLNVDKNMPAKTVLLWYRRLDMTLGTGEQCLANVYPGNATSRRASEDGREARFELHVCPRQQCRLSARPVSGAAGGTEPTRRPSLLRRAPELRSRARRGHTSTTPTPPCSR